MASIVINAGGRPMQVDVPDFAMEDTQKDVLDGIQQLVSAITGLSASNQGQSAGEQQIEDAVDDLKVTLGKKITDGYSAARDTKLGQAMSKAGVTGMVKGLQQPGMMTNFMKTIGLGGLATSFGMVIGMAEKLSSVYSFAGDVGLSFGENVLGTAERLSNIGIQLDTFGDVVATNLGAMRELGPNVEDGSQRFIGLVEDFRNSTKEFGYFGMASGEMAEFMAEELDIRRKSMDAEQLRLYIQNDLNDAMVTNFKEQQAMAKVTGQNVRERIRAQMAAQEDIRLQVAMQGMTRDQLDAIKAVTGNLTDNLGKAGQNIMDAIIQGVAVEGSEMATAGGRMAQLDTSGNIMRIIQEGIQAIRGGEDATTVNNRVAQLIQDFKNTADFETLQVQAFGGNQDATNLMQMAINTNEVTEKIAKSRNNLMTEEMQQRQKFVDSMRALTAEIDVNKAKQANLAMRSILNIGGDQTGGDLVQGIRDVVATTTELMSSNSVKTIVDAVSKAFGMVTIQPYLSLMSEDGANPAETAYILGDALSALGGNPKLVAGLRGLQTIIAGGVAADTIIGGIVGRENQRDGGGADYDKLYEKMKDKLNGLMVTIKPKFIEDLANLIKTS